MPSLTDYFVPDMSSPFAPKWALDEFGPQSAVATTPEQQQAQAAQRAQAANAPQQWGGPDPYEGSTREGAALGNIPILGSMLGPPNRMNWAPSEYAPNQQNFQLQMPKGMAEWQQGLAAQGAQQNAMAGQAWGQGQAQGQLQQGLQARGATTDYGRAVGAYQQGQQGVNVARNAALGLVPSAAEIQQRQGIEQAIAAGQAQANTGPYNPAAGIVASQRASTMMGQAQQNADLLRAQEQAQGRAQYLGALGQQQGMAAQLGGMTQGQAALAGQQALGYGQLAGQQGNLGLGYAGETRMVGATGLQGTMGYEQERGQQRMAYNEAMLAREKANQEAVNQQKGGATGALQGGLTALAMFSDERSKTQLSSAQSEIAQLRSQLSAFTGEKIAPGQRGGDPDSRASQQLRDLTASGAFSEADADEVWSRLHTSPIKSAWYQWLERQANPPGIPERSDWRATAETETGATGITNAEGTEPAPTTAEGWRAWLEGKKTSTNYPWLNKQPANLASVPAAKFKYNKPARAMGAPAGQRFGVTTQALEQAGPAGAAMVKPGPGGMKQIDIPEATGTLLATVAQQQREIEALKAGQQQNMTPVAPWLQQQSQTWGQ